MNSVGSAVPGLLLNILLLGSFAAVHAWIAWPFARRYGPKALIASPLLATLVVAGIAIAYWSWQMTALGQDAAFMLRRYWYYFVFPILLGFAVSALSIRKSIRKTDAVKLPADALARAIGAFFGGIGIVLLLALVSDIAQLRK